MQRRSGGPCRQMSMGPKGASTGSNAAGFKPSPCRIISDQASAANVFAAGQVRRDHQPVLGPGHRHVEKAVVLLGGFVLAQRPRGGDRIRIVGLAGRPYRHRPASGSFKVEEIGTEPHGASIEQEHERRFQSLGAMHGHHPHLVVGRSPGRA